MVIFTERITPSPLEQFINQRTKSNGLEIPINVLFFCRIEKAASSFTTRHWPPDYYLHEKTKIYHVLNKICWNQNQNKPSSWNSLAIFNGCYCIACHGYGTDLPLFLQNKTPIFEQVSPVADFSQIRSIILIFFDWKCLGGRYWTQVDLIQQ